MTDKVFDFWQDHSLKYLEMALSTEKQEIIQNPDGYGKRKGDCGDTVEFFLMINNNIIETAAYHINGCMNTNASAATIAGQAEGLSIEEAWKLNDQTIIDFLETIPQDHYHCAELAIGAFYLALSDYEKKKKMGWRR